MNSIECMACDVLKILARFYQVDLPPDITEEIKLFNSKHKPVCMKNNKYLLQHITGILNQLIHYLSVGEFSHNINKHNAKVVNLESAKKLIELRNRLFYEDVQTAAEKHISVELLLSKIIINLEKSDVDYVLEIYERNLSYAAIVIANCISSAKRDTGTNQVIVNNLYLFVILAVTAISLFKILSFDEINECNPEVSADLKEALYHDYVLLLVNFAIGNSSSLMGTIPGKLKLLSRKILENSVLLNSRHLQQANVRKSLFDNIKIQRKPFLCKMMPDFKKGSLEENVQLLEDSLQDSSIMSLSEKHKPLVSLHVSQPYYILLNICDHLMQKIIFT